MSVYMSRSAPPPELLSAACRVASDAVTLNPDDWHAHAARGAALLCIGELQHSGGEFDAALRLDKARTLDYVGQSAIWISSADGSWKRNVVSAKDIGTGVNRRVDVKRLSGNEIREVHLGSMTSGLNAIASAATPAYNLTLTMAPNPRQVDGLDIRPERDGCVVYQPEQDRAHFLNPTALLVLELCNGMNSTDEIVGLVKEAYGLPDAPADEVRQALTQFMAEGLLQRTRENGLAGIMPVIVTYCRDLSLFSQFVDSFRPVRAALGNPLVVVDISLVAKLTLPYVKLLEALEPRVIAIHPAQPSMNLFESVQDGCHFALVTALEENVEARAFLYLEDDIVFSSRFLDRLAQVDWERKCGFWTLYLHNDGYPSGPLNPWDFWGAQCLLIPRSTAELLVRERAEMDAQFPPGRGGGCDVRWGHYLTARGYPLYATERSYAQHLGIVSRLHGNPPHVSNCFVP